MEKEGKSLKASTQLIAVSITILFLFNIVPVTASATTITPTWASDSSDIHFIPLQTIEQKYNPPKVFNITFDSSSPSPATLTLPTSDPTNYSRTYLNGSLGVYPGGKRLSMSKDGGGDTSSPGHQFTLVYNSANVSVQEFDAYFPANSSATSWFMLLGFGYGKATYTFAYLHVHSTGYWGVNWFINGSYALPVASDNYNINRFEMNKIGGAYHFILALNRTATTQRLTLAINDAVFTQMNVSATSPDNTNSAFMQIYPFSAGHSVQIDNWKGYHTFYTYQMIKNAVCENENDYSKEYVGEINFDNKTYKCSNKTLGTSVAVTGNIQRFWATAISSTGTASEELRQIPSEVTGRVQYFQFTTASVVKTIELDYLQSYSTYYGTYLEVYYGNANPDGFRICVMNPALDSYIRFEKSGVLDAREYNIGRLPLNKTIHIASSWKLDGGTADVTVRVNNTEVWTQFATANTGSAYRYIYTGFPSSTQAIVRMDNIRFYSGFHQNLTEVTNEYNYSSSIADKVWGWGSLPALGKLNGFLSQGGAKNTSVDGTNCSDYIYSNNLVVWNVTEWSGGNETKLKMLHGKDALFGISLGVPAQAQWLRNKSDTYPNIKGGMIDDLSTQLIEEMTDPQEIANFSNHLKYNGGDLELWGVVYIEDLYSCDFSEVKDSLDGINLWVKYERNLKTLPEAITTARNIFGVDKKYMLGLYMVDYGGNIDHYALGDFESQWKKAGTWLQSGFIDSVVLFADAWIDQNYSGGLGTYTYNVSRWMRNWLVQDLYGDWWASLTFSAGSITATFGHNGTFVPYNGTYALFGNYSMYRGIDSNGSYYLSLKPNFNCRITALTNIFPVMSNPVLAYEIRCKDDPIYHRWIRTSLPLYLEGGHCYEIRPFNYELSFPASGSRTFTYLYDNDFVNMTVYSNKTIILAHSSANVYIPNSTALYRSQNASVITTINKSNSTVSFEVGATNAPTPMNITTTGMVVFTNVFYDNGSNTPISFNASATGSVNFILTILNASLPTDVTWDAKIDRVHDQYITVDEEGTLEWIVSGLSWSTHTFELVLYVPAPWEPPEYPQNGGGSYLQLTASFTFTVRDNYVAFTDASNCSSATIVRWLWDFGDGNGSVLQNPTHLYQRIGIYTVTLTVITSLDTSTSAIRFVSIASLNALGANDISFNLGGITVSLSTICVAVGLIFIALTLPMFKSFPVLSLISPRLRLTFGMILLILGLLLMA